MMDIEMRIQYSCEYRPMTVVQDSVYEAASGHVALSGGYSLFLCCNQGTEGCHSREKAGETLTPTPTAL